jgi:hypothetical protein
MKWMVEVFKDGEWTPATTHGTKKNAKYWAAWWLKEGFEAARIVKF